MQAVTKDILKFMLRAGLVTLPVIMPFIIWYICADPFKVLRHYDDYFTDYHDNPVRVGINKGLVTLTNFHDRMAEGLRYNAFIFGSSISIMYDADTWAMMADSTGTARPYHFDSSGESVKSLSEKVEYLDRIGNPVDFALIVLDPIIMTLENDDTPPVINPPQLHRSWLESVKYHYVFFRASTNADFFKDWLPAKVTGQPYDIGRSPLFNTQPIVYDPTVNQESLPEWDSLITRNPVAFRSRHPLVASPDSLTVSEPVLTPDKVACLKRIATIFRSRHTDYHIIISPNRRKVTLNPHDLALLQQIFCPGRVHDYTSALASELANDTLLYDNTHYRPAFARRLMQLTYRSDTLP